MHTDTRHFFPSVAVGVAILLATTYSYAADFDAEAAKYVARANGCFQCHSIDKDKDGPAYQKVAEKFRGNPDAEKRILFHLTSGEKAKFPDGHEEEHMRKNTRSSERFREMTLSKSRIW